MTRREFSTLLAGASSGIAQSRRPPNIVLIFADDLGYGDLGCFGHPTIRTPNIDNMATEGIKLTSFYVGAAVCSPSRAALLTGRYPPRSGVTRVLYPAEKCGLPVSEITLGQAMQKQGYTTALIGKWHLGDQPEYHPSRRGFDFFYGLLYSNDMDPRLPKNAKLNYPRPLDLFRNEEVIESGATQSTLTQRYTQQSVEFIRKNREKPFFLYMAHNMPHGPWQASPQFLGKSKRGLYGDAVEEIDWGVGQIIKTLDETGLSDNTLVIFTSDNGATARILDYGSNGLLRDGKGSAFEGGMRMPFVARWPGRIPPRTVSSDIACSLDLFTTFIELGGGHAPTDRAIDGINIAPLLFGGPSPRDEFHYFGSNLRAIRKGPWKLFLRKPPEFEPGELYHLEHDPAERIDRAKEQSAIVQDLLARARAYMKEFKFGTPVPPLLEQYRKAKA